MDLRSYVFEMSVNKKALALFVILIAVALLLYNFSIAPFLKSQEKLKLSLLSQKALLEARLDSIEKMDSMDKDVKNLRKKIWNLENKFLTKDNLPDFFTSLRKLAKDTGVDILDMQISQNVQKTENVKAGDYKYEEVPVNISMRGTCPNIMLFLDGLRNKNVLFTISRMTVSPADEKLETAGAYLGLTLYATYEKDKE